MCLLVYEADLKDGAGLLLGRSKLHPVPVQLSPANGEADSKGRAGSLVRGAGDSGAGAFPLVGGVGIQGLCLESPGGPGSSAYVLRCGGWSWGFWGLGPCPGAAVQ